MSENRIELSGIFSEGYGLVPKKLMKAQNINQTTKVVLCYLLSFTGAGVTCFPQIKDMANDLGISKRTIINCINSAIKNNYLVKHQENRGGRFGKKNIYELLFMYDINKKKQVQHSAHADFAGATDAIASAKNDNLQVQPGNSNINNINSIIKSNSGKTKFVKPSLKEIQEYIINNNYVVNAETWLAYYESNGWHVGRNKMVDWKAAIRYWHRNNKEPEKDKPKYVRGKLIYSRNK